MALLEASGLVKQFGKRRVVDGVVVAPPPKRREHEQSKNSSDTSVGALGRDQRTMRTVVKDHKHPDQEPGGRDRERRSQEEGDAEREIHERA